ncbi:ABC transporter substrate-binding protein [Streptomyces sp. NPDC054863]
MQRPWSRSRPRPDDWGVVLPPWWRRRRSRAVALVAVLAVLGGGLFWWLRPDPPKPPVDTSCATGVERVGGTCVGVTDGSYVFDRKNLGSLFAKIHQENVAVEAQAAKSGRPNTRVSVVYLMSMVPGEKDSNTPDSVRHEIQGAYTAQMEANHSNKYGDLPKIKLLLAHIGNGSAQASATLEQIRLRTPKDRIVAVAGLGTSTDATEGLIRRITAEKAPPEGATANPAAPGLDLGAVGSVLTADTLSGVPGLVRVAPVNSDEAFAAAAFLQQKEYAKKRVLVVQDKRKDDQYTQTLGDRFLAAFPKDRLAAAEPEMYDSSRAGVATAFKTRMSTICAAEPDVIYFAGRGIDLPRFLAPLKDRPCAKDRQVLVISGDDASQTAQAAGFQDIKDTLKYGNVRLVYTGLAHPGSWALRQDAYQGPAQSSFGEGGRFRTSFKGEALDDGQAIMGHDAVLTAVSGIRLAAANSETNGTVTGSDVIQIWDSLSGKDAVRGASGLISFKNDGSPEQKAIPIIEIEANGTVRTLAVSARGGKPLT